MDIEKTRKEYPDLVIMGGIDKIALAKGKKEIMEVVAKAGRVVESGGCIPYTDHAVPPDVSFDNYRFFREELAKVLAR